MASFEEVVNEIIGTTPDYSMFTPEGNAAVHALVVAAKESNTSWSKVYAQLCQLATRKEFAEATDTAVREVVYDAIGAYQREESFYC